MNEQDVTMRRPMTRRHFLALSATGLAAAALLGATGRDVELLCETGMGHVASVIAQGIFERCPNARFVLIECGIAWLPAMLWRLDADYKALRQ
jgi:predicted TIM-barrel fold metal-dependent hydrolase